MSEENITALPVRSQPRVDAPLDLVVHEPILTDAQLAQLAMRIARKRHLLLSAEDALRIVSHPQAHRNICDALMNGVEHAVFTAIRWDFAERNTMAGGCCHAVESAR